MPDSRSAITSFKRPSPKALLPTKSIWAIFVRSPSLISNTTLTRLFSIGAVRTETVASLRPMRV